MVADVLAPCVGTQGDLNKAKLAVELCFKFRYFCYLIYMRYVIFKYYLHKTVNITATMWLLVCLMHLIPIYKGEVHSMKRSVV